jgi:hypothetical protein
MATGSVRELLDWLDRHGTADEDSHDITRHATRGTTTSISGGITWQQ